MADGQKQDQNRQDPHKPEFQTVLVLLSGSRGSRFPIAQALSVLEFTVALFCSRKIRRWWDERVFQRALDIRLADGGLEFNPADTGEVDLRPGVGVFVEHAENETVAAQIRQGFVSDQLPLGIADGPAGRDACQAEQDDLGCGVIVAETLLKVEQEPVYDLLAWLGVAYNRIYIGDVLAQILGDGVCFVVGVVQSGGEVLGELACAVGDVIRDLQIAVGHPGWVIFTGLAQFCNGGGAKGGCDLVDLARADGWVRR